MYFVPHRFFCFFFGGGGGGGFSWGAMIVVCMQLLLLHASCWTRSGCIQQDTMRQHLFQCFNRRELVPFQMGG